MQQIYFNKQKLRDTVISVFDPPISNTTTKEDFDLLSIYELITDGLKRQTNELRSLSDLKELNDYKKSNLPYCTFSGSFFSRKDGELKNHSNLICIDLDNLSPVKLRVIKKRIRADLNFIMCFVSPSGNGLKIIYPIDVSIATHDQWYQAYITHLQQTCSLASSHIDPSCKNISRACFLANDPNAFLNCIIEDGGDVYPIELTATENLQISDESENLEFTGISNFFINVDTANPNTLENFNALCTRTELKLGAYRSPREPWIYNLACSCNYLGMSKEMCLEFIYNKFSSHPESVRVNKPIDVNTYLIKPIHSSYKQNKHLFGKWQEVNVNKDADSKIDKDDLTTKSFPNTVYHSLTLFLQNLCIPFEKREIDVFFMGLLGALSACFTNVSGIYDGSTVNPNLFVFITAPASAGKGNMKWARNLVKPIHDELRKESEAEIKFFNKRLAEWKDDKSLPHPGDKPIPKCLLIPGNISGTGVLQTVADNEGKGLIFETEADTLSGALAQDWGNFSDFLRKAFHHETISYKRRAGDEFVEVDNPTFSVVLSGTPLQVNNLIPNTENGLFSRFCFYSFNSESKFKNVWEKKVIGSLEDFFNGQAKILFEYYNSMKEEANITFTLTEEQQKLFLDSFTKYHDDFSLLFGKDIEASVRRLGIITFRIAMIISIFRRLEEANLMDFIICNDIDYSTALTIVDVLIDHTANIYQKLNKNGQVDLKPKPLNYFKLLPSNFDKQGALAIANSIGILPKTAESYLTNFINKNALTRLAHNQYAKIIS